MSQTETPIKIDQLITEDDTPVDSLASEKQHRLLTEPLYSSWSGPGEGRPFLVAANVGVFHSIHLSAIVPDVFLSLDVRIADDWWDKSHRSYFLWEFGKPPDVVIEIVSNREGKEGSDKLRRYANMGVSYYVIFDPLKQIQVDILTIYELYAGIYQVRTNTQLPTVHLGLMLWEGTFEHKQATWLRWCNEQGMLIPTGKERAEEESQRAERLAARLRALGEDPNQI
ncbi:MAG: Uma2 family endonuclease [Acidobacteriota bacterium]